MSQLGKELPLGNQSRAGVGKSPQSQRGKCHDPRKHEQETRADAAGKRSILKADKHLAGYTASLAIRNTDGNHSRQALLAHRKGGTISDTKHRPGCGATGGNVPGGNTARCNHFGKVLVPNKMHSCPMIKPFHSWVLTQHRCESALLSTERTYVIAVSIAAFFTAASRNSWCPSA